MEAAKLAKETEELQHQREILQQQQQQQQHRRSRSLHRQHSRSSRNTSQGSLAPRQRRARSLSPRVSQQSFSSESSGRSRRLTPLDKSQRVRFALTQAVTEITEQELTNERRSAVRLRLSQVLPMESLDDELNAVFVALLDYFSTVPSGYYA